MLPYYRTTLERMCLRIDSTPIAKGLKKGSCRWLVSCHADMNKVHASGLTLFLLFSELGG